MPGRKTFIYQYETDPEGEEEDDPEGRTEIPRAGDLICRRDKVLKVTGVFTECGSAIPTYRVLLTDVSKPIESINF
jgi:hypothetical protein